MSLDAIRQRLASRRAQLRALSIAVLCGGGGAERTVSLTSGANVAQALAQAGFDARLLPIAADWLSIDHAALSELSAGLPQGDGEAALMTTQESGASALFPLRDSGMVFTTMHGQRGEDGVWQGLLELLNLPYVSAGVKGSALAFDKLSSKRLFSQLSVSTPPYCVLRSGDDPAVCIAKVFEKIVAKPVEQGSSVGVVITQNDSAGHAQIAGLLEQYGKLLIEQYIEGSEVTCGVIGRNTDPITLPLVQIVPGNEFYDYEAKYSSGGSNYICPAPLPEETAELIRQQSAMLYREMELEPYARFDCIVDSGGQPQFLEVNTLPGFTEFSLLPKAAKEAGISFSELIEMLMLFALERHEERG